MSRRHCNNESQKGSARAGQVRLIAGRWRGRRLPVVSVPGLRPTGDRLRETLFNWLAPLLPGSRCLDLFAGSGALGLEAASRGAREVVLLEYHNAAFEQLQRHLAVLGNPPEVTVQCADARRWLAQVPVPFDVVFIDPPWDSGWHEALLHQVAAGWIGDGGRIFLEQPVTQPAIDCPGLAVLRRAVYGRARGTLYSPA